MNLRNVENEFLLGDLQVFREFDVSSITSTASFSLNNACNFITMKINFMYYINILENALRTFSNVSLDTKSMHTFFVDYLKSNVQVDNIYIRKMVDQDVFNIKPEYLVQFSENIANIISRTISNGVTKEEVTKYVSSEIASRVKKQIVQTTGSFYDKKTKDLIRERSDEKVKLTNEYIKEDILPFVDSFDSSSTSMIAKCEALIRAIKSSEECIVQFYGSTKPDTSKANMKMVNYVMYNSLRAFLEVLSFVTYMTIRKMNNIQANGLICNMLYDSLNSLNITESSVIGDIIVPTDTDSITKSMISGNVDAYEVLANKVYNFYTGDFQHLGFDEGSPNPLKEIQRDGFNYNTTAYNDAISIFETISSGLDEIADMSDEYVIVSDEIISQSGFSMELSAKFQSRIEMLDDISIYTSAVNVIQPGAAPIEIFGKMLAELKDYGENMKEVSKAINACGEKIADLQKRFEQNINSEYKNLQAVKELLDFINTLYTGFEGIVKEIAVKFMNRLNGIAYNLKRFVENNNRRRDKEEMIPEIDFNESVMDMVVDEFEATTDTMCEQLKLEYMIAREKKERGVTLILEADDNTQTKTTNNNTTSTTQSNNKQTTTNTSELQPATNSNTKPETNNTATDTQNNQTSNVKGEKTVNNIVNQINKWFNSIMEKINGLMESANAKADQEYLSAAKNDLLNRNYNNRFNRIPIIEYEKLMPYTRITNDMDVIGRRTSTGSLTPQKIQSCADEKALLRVVFGTTVPENIWTTDDKPQSITSFYKCGTYTENKVVVRNGDLKKMVADAVNYCEPYYTKFLPKLKTSIERIKNNMSASLESMVKENAESFDFGNLFLEADDPNAAVNTVTSMASKCNTIERYVQIYCNAVLTAAFDRYKDYMGLLRSIVPSTQTDAASTTNTETPATNQTQQKNTNA